jgi:uracil-DNA glycosylase
MTITEIQTKLYERLKPSGWGDKLKMFIMSDEFNSILTQLWNESKEGVKFTPVVKDLFRAFEECPYNDLKIVFVGQDPYPQANVADGISFSCSYTNKEQPSLRYIFDEIHRTIYGPNFPPGDNDPNRKDYDPDLKRWSNQGILMLNTALTCSVNNIGSHIKLWEPFIQYLFDMLNNSNTGILYVFLGNKAKPYAKYISKNNYKFFAVHPAAAAYKGGVWNSGDLFNQINSTVNKLYGEKIEW